MSKLKVRLAIVPDEYRLNDVNCVIEIHRTDESGMPNGIIIKLNEANLDTARKTIEGYIKRNYEVIGIHKIPLGADLGSVLNKGVPTHKKEVELSPLLPSFVHYRIPIKEFAEHVVQWFKIEKGWDVVVTVGCEGPDDIGYLGDFYFNIDTERTGEETLEKMIHHYGDLDYLLTDIMQEMFKSKRVSWDCEPWHKVLYIYLPIEEYEERKKHS